MDLVTSHAVEVGVIIVLVTFVVLWIYSYSLSLASKPGVPKGRFWQVPFVGETLALTSGKFEHFLVPRIERYGRNFRTHLLGDPCIFVTSFDQIKFVLQSPRSFKRIFPKATKDLLAGDSVRDLTENHGGHVHRGLNKESVRKFIPDLDRRCKDMLKNWESMEKASLFEEVEKFAFTSACIFNCDYLLSEEDMDSEGTTVFERTRRALHVIREGLITLPVNIPGFRYYKAMKIRKRLEQELLRFITRRKAEEGRIVHHDMLDVFLRAGQAFTDAHLVEVLIGFLFAALDTSATVLTWAVIELLLRPELAATLREENDRLVQERRRRPDDSITLEDIYEKLPMTNQVIQETLRFHNIAALTVREATQDVVFEGIVFPKGWKVIVSWLALHFDPSIHSNPRKFDPSRFASERASKPNSYMPFSYGPSACKGQDAFKAEAVIMLHHLMAGYDFKMLGTAETLYSDLSYWPTPRPRNPVFVTVSKRQPEAQSTQ